MLFCRGDAERVLDGIGTRLGKYGLALHHGKTSMVDLRYKPKPANDGGDKVGDEL